MLRVTNHAAVIALVAALASSSALAQPSPDAAASPARAETLAVAGFESNENLDARDTWMATAVSEVLAWRLRRTPGMTVMPTMRVHQGRQELTEKPTDSIAVERAVRLLGAKHWLHGRCSGTPDAIIIDLELARVGDEVESAERTQIGPARLFDALDQATRWVLRQRGVDRLDAAVERLMLGQPAQSPSALEYHAKALLAARAGNARDALFYIQNALTYDQDYAPTLVVLAKLEMQAGPRTRNAARVHLRHMREIAGQRGDAITETDFDLNYGLTLVMDRSFDAARQRFETALSRARKLGDPYGELAALNALCDLALSWEAPRTAEPAPESQPSFRETKLREAVQWQVAALEKLRELDDRIAEAPAANKLALVYEQLGEDEWALKMHKWTVSAARKMGSRRSEATGWLFLGQWYRKNERWEEALDATRRCLELVQTDVRPRVLMLLAEIQRGMQQPSDALKSYQTACAELESADDLVSQFRCLRGIAEIQHELGQREPAIKTMVEALDIGEVLGLAEAAELKQLLETWRNEPQ